MHKKKPNGNTRSSLISMYIFLKGLRIKLTQSSELYLVQSIKELIDKYKIKKEIRVSFYKECIFLRNRALEA